MWWHALTMASGGVWSVARAEPDRLLIVGISVAAACALAQATAQLVDFWAFGLRIAALNGNTESNAFSWLAGAAMLGTTAAFALSAKFNRELRATSLALVGLFGLLLVDNRIGIHERLPHGKLMFLPLLGCVFALAWKLSASPSGQGRVLLRIGLASLFVSLLVHLIGPSVLAAGGWHTDDWEYQLKVSFKEATELAGWVLMFFGSLTLVTRPRRLQDAQAA